MLLSSIETVRLSVNRICVASRHRVYRVLPPQLFKSATFGYLFAHVLRMVASRLKIILLCHGLHHFGARGAESRHQRTKYLARADARVFQRDRYRSDASFAGFPWNQALNVPVKGKTPWAVDSRKSTKALLVTVRSLIGGAPAQDGGCYRCSWVRRSRLDRIRAVNSRTGQSSAAAVSEPPHQRHGRTLGVGGFNEGRLYGGGPVQYGRS
jgi:hypothetical protein